MSKAKTPPSTTSPVLNNMGAESAVLAGIAQHGADLFIDIEEILNAHDFYGEGNRRIWQTMKYMVHDRCAKEFDVPTLLMTAKAIGFPEIAGKNRDEEYVGSLFDRQISADNCRETAVQVYKLSLGRQAFSCTRGIQAELGKIQGHEPLSTLLALIEDPIFSFTGKLTATSNSLTPIGHEYMELMDALAAAPKDIAGLSTGYHRYDLAIGGGLRPATVNVIGARPKNGKSFLCLNMGHKIANAKIPVLYLDTELPRNLQLNRLASLVTNVELDHIETGKYAAVAEERKAIVEMDAYIRNLKLTHCSIAGQSIRVVLSIARRWLTKLVGFNDEGKAKPCVVIYDYLKLMDAGDIKTNLAEYQLLGFLLSEMHNFTLKYDIPFLCTVQLNRAGVDSEGGDVISGSDRILWLCSSFSLVKRKSQEELAEDPATNGDRKLVVTDTRFGPGMEPGDYLNLKYDLARARIDEGEMFSTIAAQSGFPTNEQKAEAKKKQSP